jgi:hypothetical protein
MIQHYLKVAFRNMRKYKGQTLISVAGLAVEFVCFAMATLWIRYEMSYDVNHEADFLMIDSSFFSMFDVKVVEGSMDFLIPESGKIAITRDKSLQLF